MMCLHALGRCGCFIGALQVIQMSIQNCGSRANHIRRRLRTERRRSFYLARFGLRMGLKGQSFGIGRAVGAVGAVGGGVELV